MAAKVRTRKNKEEKKFPTFEFSGAEATLASGEEALYSCNSNLAVALMAHSGQHAEILLAHLFLTGNPEMKVAVHAAAAVLSDVFFIEADLQQQVR